MLRNCVVDLSCRARRVWVLTLLLVMLEPAVLTAQEPSGNFQITLDDMLGQRGSAGSSINQAIRDIVEQTDKKGGVLVLPSGEFVLEEPIELEDHITIRGQGRTATVLVAGQDWPGGAVIVANTKRDIRVMDLMLRNDSAYTYEGNNSGSTDKIGIRLSGVTTPIIRNVRIDWFETGLWIEGAINQTTSYGYFEAVECQVKHADASKARATGIRIGRGVTANTFVSCRANHTQYGIDLNTTYGGCVPNNTSTTDSDTCGINNLTFLGCAVEGDTENGLQDPIGYRLKAETGRGIWNVVFANCRAEIPNLGSTGWQAQTPVPDLIRGLTLITPHNAAVSTVYDLGAVTPQIIDHGRSQLQVTQLTLGTKGTPIKKIWTHRYHWPFSRVIPANQHHDEITATTQHTGLVPSQTSVSVTAINGGNPYIVWSGFVNTSGDLVVRAKNTQPTDQRVGIYLLVSVVEIGQ